MQKGIFSECLLVFRLQIYHENFKTMNRSVYLHEKEDFLCLMFEKVIKDIDAG